MLLNASLLNTQYYKVRIQGKVVKSGERSSHICVVAIEKGAIVSFSTKVANFTFYFF